ncbi:hypothetical protein G7084_00165 [Weissella coleopterorum]|uniref:Uncharacterized protein n=1 Tax=Weissella coleopterorum TaxID=2714949 RepID=A0A6G8AXU3_9LACO|nr:hypothetical protein [Weissella coleopterorum]QIL49874.1 hypothetical protein G7084_00165 [Weissella coleopterorum]
MIKFIKKNVCNILFLIGVISYLITLITDKHWYDLFMTVLLYIIIFEQIYYQNQSAKIYEEYIELLEKIIREN